MNWGLESSSLGFLSHGPLVRQNYILLLCDDEGNGVIDTSSPFEIISQNYSLTLRCNEGFVLLRRANLVKSCKINICFYSHGGELCLLITYVNSQDRLSYVAVTNDPQS